MIKMEQLAFGKVSEGLVKHLFTRGFLRVDLSFAAVSFLIGRCQIADGLMPFGFALFTAALLLSFNPALAGLCALAGMLSNGLKGQMAIYLLAAAAFTIISINNKGLKSASVYAAALFATVCILVPDLLFAYLQGFLLYDILRALLQALITYIMVILFKNSFSLFTMKPFDKVISSEEIIGISVMLSLAVLGIGSIQLAGFSIKNIVSILLLFIISYCYGPGIGSSIGITVGLISSMSMASSPAIIGDYGFCSLLAGVFRILGRTGTGLGFLLGNTIITLYLNGSTDVIIHIRDMAAAFTLFALVPGSALENLKNVTVSSTRKQDMKNYGRRIRDITVKRLNKFSSAFRDLSATLGEISTTKTAGGDKQELSILFDQVAESVCKDCSLCLHCWERNFYGTYQAVFSMAEKLEEKGRLEYKDLPAYFTERCSRTDEFIQSVNSSYEIFRINMMWKNKIGESRSLVGQQLEGLSSVISSLASEISMDVKFKEDIEEMIAAQFYRGGLKIEDVSVYENKHGKYEVSVVHKGCSGRRVCVSTIEKLVSGMVGRKMTREIKECGYDSFSRSCTLRLVEEEKYKVTTGVARTCRFDTGVSGDNHGFMNTGDGKYIAVVSDGMGSGSRAAAQSKAAVSMFEQFIESGFDKDTAIKVINSFLMLRSGDENYTTVDITIIDLYSGEAEFVKIGAVPTVIKREERLEIIKSVTLPIGILSSIEPELQCKRLRSGDFVIMMTDGISESSEEEENKKWLYGLLESTDTSNPQELADMILEAAFRNYNGKPLDDMLVVVSKIWERCT